MTRLLTKAIDEMKKLSPAEQDAMAQLLLDELADERRWDESFARSQEQLTRWAQQVREDIRSGRVQEMGIDEL